jgi:hypothetical protein
VKTVGERAESAWWEECVKSLFAHRVVKQREVCNAKEHPFAPAYTMIFLKLMEIFTESHFSTVLYMYNAVLTIFFENVCKCVHSAKSHSR